MSKFYLYLWMRWAVHLTLSSLSLAFFLSFCISLYLYISQGMPPITIELKEALFAITKFWFLILWSLTLLLSLFRTLKGVFNTCYNNYKLQLLTCPNEGKTVVIEEVGYGDLLKVWRKWFILIIWLVGTQMIIALIIAYIFNATTAIFDWFNIYVLYTFILLAGYLSFMIIAARCKRVKLVKC